jgi:ATP-dependent DNA helicase PIF1
MKDKSEEINETNLSQEQHIILDACNAGKSIFLSGGAGTGKSFLLSIIIKNLVKLHGKDSIYVTATTGLAASALGGVTLHQYAGLNASISNDENYLNVKKYLIVLFFIRI